MATPYLIVCVTAPAGKKASDLASAFVATRLAACVNVVPGVQSVYRWKGRVERARESLFLAKIRRRDFARFEALVRKLHPYDVPEVVALGIERGSRPYLDWLGAETRSR